MMRGGIDHEFRDSRCIRECFLTYLFDHYVGDTKTSFDMRLLLL